jgi:hypothetical protein
MDQSENTPFQYNPNGSPGSAPDAESSAGPAASRESSKNVSWQAPEFIEHPHPGSWYAGLTVITAALAAVVYLTTKDIFATGTIMIMGIIVWVFAGHKPGLAQYELNNRGLSINGKLYPYSGYKSFTILREGDFSSVNLFPLKRFMPPISAYYGQADEQKITDALGDQLPYEERQMDGVDRLARRLRL